MIKKTTHLKKRWLYLLLVICNSIYSQTTIASDNFDSGWGNWNSGGVDAFLTTSNPLNATQVVNLQDDTGIPSSITSNNIDLSTYGYATIQFDYRTRSFWWGLDFWVQYSDDGGITWYNLSTLANVVNFDNDTNYSFSTTINISNYTFSTNSRFRIRCDANNDNNDLFIDNIIITASPPAPDTFVTGNNIEIDDGDNTPYIIDNTNFGSAAIGTTMTRTFTIGNNGTTDLNITNISLSNSTDFSIVGTPFSSPVSVNNSTSFSVMFNSLTTGISTTEVIIDNDDPNENPYNFTISAEATISFFDSDGDGVFDNEDIDDDNDGIPDSYEESACKNSNISITTNYKFLNETFGSGNRAEINTTYDAYTTYCYEDGTSSCPSLGGIDLNDGEYTVYYKAANGDGINDTPIEELASWADDFWYTGEDHTPGDINGRMAMFNAALDPGIFYTASITGALPNVPVTYSFWALNLDRTDAPDIATRLRPDILVEFRDVNDNVLASITTGDIPATTASNSSGDWYNFTADLTFPVSEFNVYFYNNQFGGLGNDLALDDIEISQTLCDTDSDGVADVFDLDSDNDGIPDIVEAGFGTYSNGTAKIDVAWVDLNGNGMHDALEGATILDSDGDGTPNFLDLDSDNDTIFDVDESGANNSGDVSYQNGDGDINGDGVGDGTDSDAYREKDFNSDGTSEYFTDGILDIYDFYEGGSFSAAYGNDNQGVGNVHYVLDSDGDGLPDYMDSYNDSSGTYDISHTLYANLDANNDGIIDDTNDTDGDGILDLFDTDDAVFGSPRDLDLKLQLYFDGRNDYIQDSSITSNWPEITLMGWIKIDPSGSGNRILFGQNNFYIRLKNDNSLEVLGGKNISNPTQITTNQWTHVAATYSATEEITKLYINGKEIAQTSRTGNLNTDSSLFTIAKNASSNTEYFKGYLDEVRLFNKALSEDEIHKMVYQEIENNTLVRGTEIPRDIQSLPWTNLIRYYRLDAYKDDITDDLTTATIDTETGAKLYNIKVIEPQSAPMPFVTQTENTDLVSAVTIPSKGVNGNDAVTYDWSIVRIEHNDITYNNNQGHLGLFINEEDSSLNPIEYHVTNDSEVNVSWYLKLDGFMDLEGESQLVQGDDSMLDPTSKGKIEQDQQGTADKYTYNYWASPVSIINQTSNNLDYSVSDVLMDGSTATNPQPINWISSGYDGTNTNPIGLADYWIWKFANLTSGEYSAWQHIRSGGSLTPGEGFTMKGPGTGSILTDQNYVFVGKPNNGDISLTINAGNDYLVGNPYPSAIDANQFILDNGPELDYDPTTDATPTLSGTLYFWEHWGGGSHILSEYQGGYATYNFSGAVAAASMGTNDPDVGTGGTPTKTPGRYIPVGQGFFVVGENTGTINFNNGQRIFVKEGGSSSVFMRNADATTSSQSSEDIDERMKFRFGFNSVNTIRRQVLLTIDQNTTPNVDWAYDAILTESQIDDMFWIINDDKYIIQASNEAEAYNVYPLGIKTDTDGINTITIDALENVPSDVNIYIHDTVLNLYHNLRSSDYEVFLNAGEYLDRFEITFTNQPETLGEEKNEILNIDILYSSNKEKLVLINPNLIEIKSIELFNMLGQSIHKFENISESGYSEYEVKNLSTGTYIIKLYTVSGSVSTKKVLVK